MSKSSIHCIVDIYVKPEALEKVRAILLKIVEDSRAEDGCMEYNLFENISDRFQFTFIEVWETEDAFEDHLQSDHIRQASVNVNEDLTKTPDIKRYKKIQVASRKKIASKTSRFCTLI
ncbi:unnamed protein product [Rotaria sordida]|uniref:ABM domain-containing protein n=1 Tax=Rotaria sordida TaxID=392033 RepID=A0A818VPI8_9BILA|nr:unnamed protein product [Rotaria sordida]CAF1132207.1 unnamed protein product [Rotaria sordida]CAF1441646.1 unnamed protein product [Rotaria sordida]CAF3714107.1 unnamed protein product [Rotaria sordida]